MKVKVKYWILALGLFFGSCTSSHYISDVTEDTEEVGAQISKDATLEAMLVNYRQELQEEMGEVIGRADIDLIKDRPESTMGNWVADCIHSRVQRLSDMPVNITIQNQGGLRIPELPKGEITRGNIYELMPFDNMVVLIDMEGSLVQTLLDHLAQSGGWPISQSVSMSIQDGEAKSVKVNGEALDLKRIYRVALPDYVANGGSDSDFLVGMDQVETGALVRDLLLQCVMLSEEEGKPITTQLDGRITRM